MTNPTLTTKPLTPSATAPAGNTLRADAAVTQMMEPIDAILERFPGATEFAMVRPSEAFIEQSGAWHRLDVPEFNMKRCLEFANVVAIYANQDISERAPLLSATLPAGQRIQIVVPPAVERGLLSMCIRIPGVSVRTLESYVHDRVFDRFVWTTQGDTQAQQPQMSNLDKRLTQLLLQRDLMGFFVAAVRGKKNIAVVGDTGSGKTTLMKAVCQYIAEHERIITIEDVRELFLPKHPNASHLLYSKGSQGVAKVTPADLIGACMRLKPDRVLLAELRGSEAFDFLKLMTAGHSGSITSFHAESCELAAQRYVFMSKEHPDAAMFTDEALKRLVSLTIDIIVHITAERIEDNSGQAIGVDRYVTQVSFNPAQKSKALA
jgi:type IV secretion system protein VirB11